MAEFNIQAELHEMREERRNDHAELVRDVREGFKAGSDWMHQHELSDQKRFQTIDARLKPFESVKRVSIWLIGALIVAWLGAVAMVYTEHFEHPKVDSKPATVTR